MNKLLFPIFCFFLFSSNTVLYSQISSDYYMCKLFIYYKANGVNKIDLLKFSSSGHKSENVYKNSKTEALWVGGENKLIKNDYILTVDGSLFSIKEKKFIFKKSELDFECKSFYEILNDSIIFNCCHYISNNKKDGEKFQEESIDECCYYYDISDNEIRFGLIDELSLPGIVNPNNTASLVSRYHSQETYLYRSVTKFISLGKKFHAEVKLMSNEEKPPYLWLTDSTFLTQIGNGKIVLSNIRGDYQPVLTIPNAKYALYNSPKLYFDGKKNIVYEFEYVSNNRKSAIKRVRINLENNAYQDYEPIFYYENFTKVITRENKIFLEHNNKPLIKTKLSSKILFFDNNVAIAEFNKKQSNTTLKIWSATTKKWSVLKFPYFVELIGWIKND